MTHPQLFAHYCLAYRISTAVVFRTGYINIAFVTLANGLGIALSIISLLERDKEWDKIEKKLKEAKDSMKDYKTALYKVRSQNRARYV